METVSQEDHSNFGYKDPLGLRICLSTLNLPPGPNRQCTSSSMDWMLLKRAGGINNQKEGEDNFHVDVFLKWEAGDEN